MLVQLILMIIKGTSNFCCVFTVSYNWYYLCLFRSGEAVSLVGWSLSNISDGTEGNEFTYKFPRGVNLAGGESCTVWSSDSQQVMNIPLVPFNLRFYVEVLVHSSSYCLMMFYLGLLYSMKLMHVPHFASKSMAENDFLFIKDKIQMNVFTQTCSEQFFLLDDNEYFWFCTLVHFIHLI